MTKKYTPGPWKVDCACGRIVANDARETIVVGGFGGSIDNPEVYADASLIACAPELLEALEMALEWIDAVPMGTPLPAMPGFDRDVVDYLIAKAKGES